MYDPCCGSGGMLMIAKEHITIGVRRNGGTNGADLLRPAINAGADIHLFGQEVSSIGSSNLARHAMLPFASTPSGAGGVILHRTTAAGRPS